MEDISISLWTQISGEIESLSLNSFFEIKNQEPAFELLAFALGYKKLPRKNSEKEEAHPIDKDFHKQPIQIVDSVFATA